MSRAPALVLLGVLAVCGCGGPEVAIEITDYDARAGIEQRQRFVTLAPLLDLDARAWCLSDAAAIASQLSGHYAPDSVAAEASGAEVLPLPEETPEPSLTTTTAGASNSRRFAGTGTYAELVRALRLVEDRLAALGYQPAPEATAIDEGLFVVSLGATWLSSPDPVRLDLTIGALLDGEFQPDLIALSALAEPARDVTLEELTRQLAAYLPARQLPEDPPAK